jgi:hypothetical protein
MNEKRPHEVSSRSYQASGVVQPLGCEAELHCARGQKRVHFAVRASNTQSRIRGGGGGEQMLHATQQTARQLMITRRRGPFRLRPAYASPKRGATAQ